MSSVFTKIINGEIPCYKIYEDAKTLAFLDIHPQTLGHTLVIPKKEIDKIYDLEDEDLVALMLTVKKISTHMEEVFGARTIWKVIGNDVPHAHVHVMPFDETWHQGRYFEPTKEEFEAMRQKLALD